MTAHHAAIAVVIDLFGPSVNGRHDLHDGEPIDRDEITLLGALDRRSFKPLVREPRSNKITDPTHPMQATALVGADLEPLRAGLREARMDRLGLLLDGACIGACVERSNGAPKLGKKSVQLLFCRMRSHRSPSR